MSVLLFTFHATANAQTSPEAEVLTLERAFLAALERANTGSIRAASDGAHVQVDTEGKVVDAHSPVVPVLAVRDVTVRVFGDVAVAIGTTVGPLQVMRYSRVWLRTSKGWVPRRSQSTRVDDRIAQPTIRVPAAGALDDETDMRDRDSAVHRAEQRRAEALRTGDVTALEMLTGDEYMAITAEGLYKTLVAAIPERRPGLRLEEMSVDLRGPVAIVTGVESDPAGAAAIFTRVWARRLSDWICVFEHLTTIAARR